MITPRTRLLVLFGLTVVPAAALTSSPGAAWAAWWFIGSFVVVAFLDAVLGSRNLEGVALSLPEVVRFVRRRKGVIPVTVRNAGAGVSRVRAGIVLSETLGCDAEDFTVDLPARGEAVTALLHAIPQTRGTFAVDAAALEAPSPLGLWAARRRIAMHSEIRVYPDLGADQSVVVPLLMRRHPGLHVQRQAGRGRED